MQALPAQRARSIGLAARLTAGLLASIAAFGPAPALAGERRAALRVTATIVPACRVSGSAVHCGSGQDWSAASSARRTAPPLAQAESLLGEPVLREGRLFFSGAQSTAPELPTPARDVPSYLTIFY